MKFGTARLQSLVKDLEGHASQAPATAFAQQHNASNDAAEYLPLIATGSTKETAYSAPFFSQLDAGKTASISGQLRPKSALRLHTSGTVIHAPMEFGHDHL